MTIAAKRNQRREAIINAARLGGAKGTLYNYFGNKEELFEALVRDFCARWADCMLGATLGGSPAESLTAFAEQYLTHLFSEQGVKLLRRLVAESHRNPQLSRIFYALGPVRGREGLEAYLEACKAKRLIDAPNCALAADELLAGNRRREPLIYVLGIVCYLCDRSAPGRNAKTMRTDRIGPPRGPMNQSLSPLNDGSTCTRAARAASARLVAAPPLCPKKTWLPTLEAWH